MSWNSHRRKLLDGSQPLAHRASHLRSCALLLAQKRGVTRAQIIALVLEHSGVSLDEPADAAALLRAFTALEALRSPD